MMNRLHRGVVIVPLAVTLLCGCRSHPLVARSVASPPPNLVSAAPALSPQELADRVEQAYLGAKSIHIKSTAIRGDDRLEIEYDGTQDSFRTICFHEGELYGAFSFDKGRVQEFVPGHPQRLILHYDSEYEDQIPWLVHPRPLDCNYGGQFALWVGPGAASGHAGTIKRIGEGELVGRENINGRACDIVHWTRTVDRGDGTTLTIRQKYYIDIEDFVFRRYDTWQNELHQVRIYEQMDLGREEERIDLDVWSLLERRAASALAR